MHTLFNPSRNRIMQVGSRRIAPQGRLTMSDEVFRSLLQSQEHLPYGYRIDSPWGANWDSCRRHIRRAAARQAVSAPDPVPEPAPPPQLQDLPRMSDVIREALAEVDIATVDGVRAASDDFLIALPHIGPVTVARWREFLAQDGSSSAD